MNNFIFSVFSDASLGLAQLILRVGLGLVFVIHGWPKIKNPKNFAGWLSAINIKPAMFWAVIVAAVEFFGGLALIFGILVPFAALLIAVNMVVAIVKVKRKFVGGWEFDFALLIMALALIFLG